MKTHEGDAQTDMEPKSKRIQLSKGEKLILEAGPLIQKDHVIKTYLIILNFYAKIYCYVNIPLHSEVSL